MIDFDLNKFDIWERNSLNANEYNESLMVMIVSTCVNGAYDRSRAAFRQV